MAKPKRSGSSSGLRKNHGPKRHLFKDYKPMVHVFGKSGILTKYSNRESFNLSCQARGIKNPTKEMWDKFCILPIVKAKDEFLANLTKN
jgi:hypothetical protein